MSPLITTTSGSPRRTSSKKSSIGSGRKKFKWMSVSQAMRFMTASIAILHLDRAVVFEANPHFAVLVLELDLMPADMHPAQRFGRERETHVDRLFRDRVHNGDL